MFVSPAVTRGEQSLRGDSHPGGRGYHHPDHGAGARTYAVASVEKVSVNDSSGTAATTDNRVTLYTCVMNQPEYRWYVAAIQQG